MKFKDSSVLEMEIMGTETAGACFGVDQFSRQSPKSAEETYEEPQSEESALR
jgi:hypothetical protein